ncbi:ClpP/crotonase [Phanerochaete sordida]|uniref:ClpP/crotonase n=1 Tax=Phanerochaete sordida TaxID=48140 RepID=A0A9P3LCI4_9APHY|nr:ClpP/crotonase [Phanerochaete sordida]
MVERKDLTGKFIKVSEPEPHVLLVELSRGPVNAFHEPFWREFGRVFNDISNDPSVRAVVLASSLPKLFSGGLDFGGMSSLDAFDKDPGRKALQIREQIAQFQDAIAAPERCPVPVVAAIHGVAYGLAIDIVSACDVRYAAENVRFSVKEVDIGLAADIGTLARLPKITGNQSFVRELAFTGRDFTAAEALQMGLVSKVVSGGRDQVVAAALQTAKLIASKSPIAVLGTKRVLLHARDNTVQSNLEYVATWNSAMLQSSDTPSALKGAMEKKPATFPNLGKPPTAKL